MASMTTFDLSSLAEAVDLYSHVDFNIPVPVLQDDEQDTIGDVDPDWQH